MVQGIFVAVPAYSGKVMHGCVLSIIRLERLCRERKISVGYHFVANDCLVPRARNQLVDIFRKSGYSHLLFLDADIEFDPDAILRMYATNSMIIGGAYPKKQLILNGDNLGTEYAFDFEDGVQVTDINQPVRAKYVGTGMMMIRREVFDHMIEAGCAPMFFIKENPYYSFFDTSISEDKRHLLSEDYHFCNLWKKRLGGEVFVALWTLPSCVHWGTIGYRSPYTDKLITPKTDHTEIPNTNPFVTTPDNKLSPGPSMHVCPIWGSP